MNYRLKSDDVTYALLSSRYYLNEKGRICHIETGEEIVDSLLAKGYYVYKFKFGFLGQITYYYHRAVAMLYYKRDLLKTEQVHHINKDSTDNRPENLEIVSNAATHAHIDRTGRGNKATSQQSIPNVNYSKKDCLWCVKFFGEYYGGYKDFRKAANRRNEVAEIIGVPVIQQSVIENCVRLQADSL